MTILVPGLQAIIAFQCIVFALYLLTGRKLDRLANRLNLAIVLTLAVHMVLNLLNQHLYQGALPNLGLGFGLFYGPLVFAYLQALMIRQQTWQRRNWLHFVPGILLSLSTLWFAPSAPLAALATFVSMAGYLGFTLVKLAEFRRVLMHTQSAQDRIAMRWASRVLLLYGAALLLNILSLALMMRTGSSVLAAWAELSVFLVLLILINAMLFKGLLQPQLFAGIDSEDVEVAAQCMSPTTVNALEEHRRVAIKAALLMHMQQQQPYLDPMFSLQSLARQLGESPRNISLIINGELQTNFSDFVNTYRIDAVKARLASPQEQRTILDIILACGFSTKSNFNRAFKLKEGMTPSEFRKTSLGG